MKLYDVNILGDIVLTGVTPCSRVDIYEGSKEHAASFTTVQDHSI
jgi:hypothetical protein